MDRKTMRARCRFNSYCIPISIVVKMRSQHCIYVSNWS
nr:MAG TPA: hypothetical protein [Crassvirales sp.]